MTAREKIEGLTNAWYGFALFAAVISVLQNGLGFLSMAWTIGSLMFSVFITFVIGRRLLARSSLTRVLLLVIGSISAAFGTLASFKLAWAFLSSWQFDVLLLLVLSAASVTMNVRSFRVLRDQSVRVYFR